MLSIIEFVRNIFITIVDTSHKKKHHKHRAAHLGIAFGLVLTKESPPPMPAEISITTEQKVSATLTPVTDTGKPAKLDGSPAWTVVSGNSQVIVADDGLSATMISSDEPGDTVVMIKADADLGEGIEELADTVTLHVVGATAKNLGLAFGTPEPK